MHENGADDEVVGLLVVEEDVFTLIVGEVDVVRVVMVLGLVDVGLVTTVVAVYLNCD